MKEKNGWRTMVLLEYKSLIERGGVKEGTPPAKDKSVRFQMIKIRYK